MYIRRKLIKCGNNEAQTDTDRWNGKGEGLDGKRFSSADTRFNNNHAGIVRRNRSVSNYRPFEDKSTKEICFVSRDESVYVQIPYIHVYTRCARWSRREAKCNKATETERGRKREREGSNVADRNPS